MKGYERQNVAELLPGDMHIEIHAETLCGIQSLWWGWAVINHRIVHNEILSTLKHQSWTFSATLSTCSKITHQQMFYCQSDQMQC